MASDIKSDVAALLRARNALLWVVTREEVRVERAIIEAAGAAKYECQLWDCATGLTNSSGEPVDRQLRDPSTVLKRIADNKLRGVYILRDLHKWLDPLVLRQVRSLARSLQAAPRNEARAVVILTPSGEIPLELQGCATVLDWPLPDRAEMGAVLDAVVAGLPEAVAGGVLQNGGRESAIDAAMGLTGDEAANCYAKSLVTSRTIDAAQVGAEKKRVIARERVLTWHDPEPRGLDAVGGLENLKSWLAVRRSALSKRARDYGLPAPKGVLLVGVPGCGKSLTAKAVASAWALPLLRLDMGALKSKWVGESEANIRKALSVAETVAPCVLWLDELEKAIGGAVSGAADGGVSADALGAVLTWLQDRKAPVFVVATANQVELLPAELIRKGRFDEMFFLDLPTGIEREAVLRTALAQFGRSVDGVDVSAVSAVTDGYSGAEIAALVPEALFAAFADGERGITTADLLAAAATVVPMSVSSSERVTKLREWSKGRCRLASVGEFVAAGDGRSLDI